MKGTKRQKKKWDKWRKKERSGRVRRYDIERWYQSVHIKKHDINPLEYRKEKNWKVLRKIPWLFNCFKKILLIYYKKVSRILFIK